MSDIRTLAHRAGLDAPGWTYDTALPLAWCDDVHHRTGIWPGHVGMVWAYAPTSIFGEPVALTPEAKAVLRAWREAGGTL